MPAEPSLAVISTSWPSVAVPWAGHFVADLTAALAAEGRFERVDAVVPEWSVDGGCLPRPGVGLVRAPVLGSGRSLRGTPLRGAYVLGALWRAARGTDATHWLCHWWPTLLAAPPSRRARRVVCLHGSDVDLLERLPRMAARQLARSATLVAVAEGLARRVSARSRAQVHVLALGARVGGRAPWPAHAESWRLAAGPKVLTVARDAPGKGLWIARAAADLAPELTWFIGEGLRPDVVRQMVASADLVVVPSIDGPGLPREGRPHVIAQALVAGTPVLGGPNRAVVEALEAAGMPTVSAADPAALARSVRAALAAREELGRRALAAGGSLHWSEVARRFSARLLGGPAL